mgnify:CR=1 FL=1
MSISAALPSMTAAPSNGKKREIHKGGYKDGLQPNIKQLQASGPGLFIAREKGTFMNDCQRRQIETMRKQGWDTRPSPGKRSCHGTAYGIIAAGII